MSPTSVANQAPIGMTTTAGCIGWSPIAALLFIAPPSDQQAFTGVGEPSNGRRKGQGSLPALKQAEPYGCATTSAGVSTTCGGTAARSRGAPAAAGFHPPRSGACRTGAAA